MNAESDCHITSSQFGHSHKIYWEAAKLSHFLYIFIIILSRDADSANVNVAFATEYSCRVINIYINHHFICTREMFKCYNFGICFEVLYLTCPSCSSQVFNTVIWYFLKALVVLFIEHSSTIYSTLYYSWSWPRLLDFQSRVPNSLRYIPAYAMSEPK